MVDICPKSCENLRVYCVGVCLEKNSRLFVYVKK